MRFHRVPIWDGSWRTHMASKKGPVSASISICIGPTGSLPPVFVRSGVANETLFAARGEQSWDVLTTE